jgi:hypothetical protein
MSPDEIKSKAKEIKHTPIGRVLFEYLKLRKAEATTQMEASRDTTDVFRAQGRAQELNELIKLFDPENK